MASSVVLEKSAMKNNHHHRAASTLLDKRPDLLNPPNIIPPPGGSSHTAKETFLNYFFGAPNGNEPPPPGGGSGEGRVVRNTMRPPPSSFNRDMLPDLSSKRRPGSKAGLEGNTAFDMRSLGKHIEPVGLLIGTEYRADELQNPHEHLTLTPKEEMETTLIRSLIGSYFSIVRQSIQDLVPKAIMHLMVSSTKAWRTSPVDRVGQVNFSRDSVQQRLVTSLYKPDLFAELLYEDETLVTERARVKALLDAYREGFRVLSEVSLKST